MPIAPITVYIASPVPTDNLLSDCDRMRKLANPAATVDTLGLSRVKPSVYFKPRADRIATQLAIKRYSGHRLTLSAFTICLYNYRCNEYIPKKI